MRYERSTENVYACYLNPGTYYYRGRRWNGTGTLSFKTYLGFVRMKTSNADVAVINNKAVVTARKKGKCKITFTLSNGKKAVVAVVVKKGK